MAWRIDSINLGTIQSFRADGVTSAIAKLPTDRPVAVGWLGLGGDAQADLTVHGGPDKAIHHYPRDHYPAWESELGLHPLLQGEGAFGENLSTLGLTEDQACIGDQYRLGSALIEISQGRQPCWKLDHRFAHRGLSAAVIRSGRAGWYYRVLEPGTVTVGDHLELIARPLAIWTVASVFDLLIAGGHQHDPSALRRLAAEPLLAENWRSRAIRLLS